MGTQAEFKQQLTSVYESAESVIAWAGFDRDKIELIRQFDPELADLLARGIQQRLDTSCAILDHIDVRRERWCDPAKPKERP